MSEILEYKCPNCSGALEFDTKSQKMKCPYCDSEFDMETLKALDDSINATKSEDTMNNWNTAVDNEWAAGEDDGLCTYSCKSCGGEIIGDENMGATPCPYCGNPVVISGKFKGELKPDLIIPFVLDKKAAKAALENHLKGKKLLPKIFRQQNHIDEIKGIYVPFRMYDAEVDGRVSYTATTVRAWSDSEYNYKETCFFDVLRCGETAFENIPVDASTKMDDDLMDSIEPFDLSKAVNFQTAYLAGYLADKYDVTEQDSLPRINARVKQSTEDVFRSTVIGPYATVTTKNSYINLKNGSAKYALLPVWILNTTWNGQKYTFAMNGQTGKFVGNLPIDKGLYSKFFAASFAISAIIGAGIGFLMNIFLK